MLDADDVIQLYEGWKTALANGNLKALEVICDTDFIRTTAKGAMKSRAEVMAAASSGSTVYEAWTSQDQRVRFFGKNAILHCRDEVKLLEEGCAITREQRVSAVFFWDDGAWKLISTQATDIALES